MVVPVTRTPNFYSPLECKNGGEHHEIWRASSHDTMLSENLSSVGQISSKLLLTSVKIWKISMLNEFPETRRKTIKGKGYQSLRLLPLKQMAEHNLKPSVFVCCMLKVAVILPFEDSEAPNPITNYAEPLKQNKRQQTTRPPHSHPTSTFSHPTSTFSHPTSTFPSNFHIPIQHAAREPRHIMRQGQGRWNNGPGTEMGARLKEAQTFENRKGAVFEVWSREPNLEPVWYIYIYVWKKKKKKQKLPATPDVCVFSLSFHPPEVVGPSNFF